ncbi:MAG: TraR/DksA family transcriptional regulator [Thermodesulfobacteriota bacterium]
MQVRDDLSIDEFKHMLEERLAYLTGGKQAREDQGKAVELDQSRVGRLSRMDAMQQQAMAHASARRSELEVQRIRTALQRIKSGDYGICSKCEEEIAEGRLSVDPATLLCIDCARAGEK